MPNVQISVYLNDVDFAKYVQHKVKLNTLARNTFKASLKELE